jgi:splicing factor 45
MAVCLRFSFNPKNMVGPGEVDGDLDGETKEECEKYGEVNKVVIFEVKAYKPSSIHSI